MILYCSDQDFATTLLKLSNSAERCQLPARAFSAYNNKAAQLDQMHRAMHHRSHQSEY